MHMGFAARQEHTMEINAKIQKNLDAQNCKVVKAYYNGYLKGVKQPSSSHVFLCNVIRFTNWLKENEEIDINKYSVYKKVKPLTINAYINEISTRVKKDGTVVPVKYSTKYGILAAIKDFFEFLKVNEYIDSNPCDKVKIQKESETREIVYMTKDEVKEVKEVIKSNENTEDALRDYAIFTLGCRTGLRETALTEINISDIDRKNLVIHDVIEKGNYKRDVYISQDTLNVIDKWLSVRKPCDTDALFTKLKLKGKNKGKYIRIPQREVLRNIVKYTENLDKHITPHKMRSTCATQLFEQTEDVYAVAEIIGHRNIQNTRKYAAVSNNRRREMTNALDTL